MSETPSAFEVGPRHASLLSAARMAMNRKNLLLLIYLRWIAVTGQVATILLAHFWFGISLPLPQMLGVVAFQIALNVISLHRRAHGHDSSGAGLFLELLLDVAALTIQLYLSGGATNPFVSLFLLQVILGAVLLDVWATWTIVVITGGCFIWLTENYEPISGLHSHHDGGFFDLHVQGMFVCFMLASVLLVFFVTRINANLRERDVRLKNLERQAVEEEHVVRLGLLASGAAHELGTPLATLSVILGDWDKAPAIKADRSLSLDLRDVQLQLRRCKEIVSGILMASGEARGEDARRTMLNRFLEKTLADWRERRKPAALDFDNRLGRDVPIVADAVLRQMITNVLDNAIEVSPDWVGVDVSDEQVDVVIRVHDKGPGFPDHMLADVGKPYVSTKQREGAGLGLFLVVNVLRKLGGSVAAENRTSGGATVSLRFPLSALGLET